jgi:sugar/nucleoside kinase (ribokinase family)
LQVFYLGGLFLMPAFDPTELMDLLRFCRNQGVVTVVDVVIPENAILPTNLRPLMQEIDYFLPNDDEAKRLTGLSDPMAQLRAIIEWGARNVIITLGQRGSIAASSRQGGDGAAAPEFWQSGIYNMPNAVDPSGCGDAFDAGLITGILKHWDMPTTLRYASALGSSATRALGTTDGVFTADEADQFIQANHLDIQSGKL